MQHNKREVDLRFHMRLGVEHILNTLDRRRGCLPFFSYYLVKKPFRLSHGRWDSPHVVGRFLDGLSNCAQIIDLPEDPEAIDALTELLHRSMVTEDGLAWNEPTSRQVRGAITHNQREALLGLIGLIKWRGCERSMALARRLCRGIERMTREARGFPGFGLTEEGWVQPDRTNMVAEEHYVPPERPVGYLLPQDSGRLIEALVKYYRISADPVALELARRFADHNLEAAFTADGQFTDAAGTHVHSITGTIAGIIDLGILLNERRYIEAGRRAYDVGLAPWRSSYGWVKEDRNDYTDWGEANNTGDIIQAALLLGKAGYAAYFEDADRMLRNHLLASQLVDIDWLEETPECEDTEEDIYSDVVRRARGGFCFSTPNDFADLTGHPDGPEINADLVGGALRGLCEAWDAIFSCDRAGFRVNLLFSKTADMLSVRSWIPERGKVEIEMFKPGNLFVRIPSWVKQEELALRINGKVTPIVTYDPYLFVPESKPGTKVEVEFPQRKALVSEDINHKTYQVEWLGDTVRSISPKAAMRPLY